MADILKFPFGKRPSEARPETKPTSTEQNDNEDEAGAEVVEFQASHTPSPADIERFRIQQDETSGDNRLLDVLSRLTEARTAGGEKSPISGKRLEYIKRALEIRQAINSLQGAERTLDNNVAIRARLVKEMEDDDLAEQFHTSTRHDWSARPAHFTAILDELTERGYFDFFEIPKEKEPE